LYIVIFKNGQNKILLLIFSIPLKKYIPS